MISLIMINWSFAVNNNNKGYIKTKAKYLAKTSAEHLLYPMRYHMCFRYKNLKTLLQK
jgi:hypothetical protein